LRVAIRNKRRGGWGIVLDAWLIHGQVPLRNNLAPEAALGFVNDISVLESDPIRLSADDAQ